MKKTDEQLISDYLEGSERALDILVDRYLADAYRFAVALTGDRHIAEDITQESFTKAWKYMRRFVPGNSFRGWLFSIVRNTAIDFLRKRRDIPFSVFENEQGENIIAETAIDNSLLPDELLVRAEDTQYVNMLLEQLNPQYREVLTLRHMSNMTFDQISTIVQRPIHTVKSQYRRGLAALRRLLETRPV